jgi:vancomycin permeability regulator SanA
VVTILRWCSFRRLVTLALIVALSVSMVVLSAAWWVRSAAADSEYTTRTVPEADVVMVLGAQVFGDRPSPFLAARLELARQLYEAGKARAILVSGDGGQAEYNEVDPMRDWLIDAGVAPGDVIGDYAGFDTYDSCARARRIFGVGSMTVVTQTFHLDRAIALCRDAGIDTNGVADESVRKYRQAWHNGSVREYGANVKALWDAWWQPDPTFLGPPETSIDDALRDT